MDVGCRQDNMNGGCAAWFKLPKPAQNIGLTGACQGGNDWLRTAIAIALTDSKSPSEAIGKPTFDDVHAETIKLISQAQLFLLIHSATGRLLSVEKSRVENMMRAVMDLP